MSGWRCPFSDWKVSQCVRAVVLPCFTREYHRLRVIFIFVTRLAWQSQTIPVARLGFKTCDLKQILQFFLVGYIILILCCPLQLITGALFLLASLNDGTSIGSHQMEIIFLMQVTDLLSFDPLKDHMDVSENSGIPKWSILIGFSIINHPFWGTIIFGNTHVSFSHDTS